jgi:hypothetical protein
MIPVANIPIPNPAIEPEKEDEMYLTLFWWAIDYLIFIKRS